MCVLRHCASGTGWSSRGYGGGGGAGYGRAGRRCGSDRRRHTGRSLPLSAAGIVVDVIVAPPLVFAHFPACER